ncbi:hypothetical protein Tco_0015459 [Tanacetum coccineum]
MKAMTLVGRNRVGMWCFKSIILAFNLSLAPSKSITAIHYLVLFSQPMGKQGIAKGKGEALEGVVYNFTHSPFSTNGVKVFVVGLLYVNTSGLKVNMSKSRLIGLGISLSEVENMANFIGCSHDSVQFIYLGLLVGKRMRRFFWGFKDSYRSLNWVKWESILCDVDKGGLGDFYEADGGLSSPLNSCGIGDTWCDILKAIENIEAVDNSFQNSFVLKSLTSGVWGGNWSWRIPPRGRALDDLSSLISRIGDLHLPSNGCDKWTWSGDASGSFKVRNLVKSIENQLLSGYVIGKHHQWNSWIPRKVNICSWRASLNRLPT